MNHRESILVRAAETKRNSDGTLSLEVFAGDDVTYIIEAIVANAPARARHNGVDLYADGLITENDLMALWERARLSRGAR